MKSFLHKFLFLLSITFMSVFLVSVKAAQISADSFGLTFGNNSLPYTVSYSAGSHITIPVNLYSYESQKQYTYLIFSVCSTGSFNNYSITNTGYNSYFNESSLLIYNTGKTSCSVSSYTGTLYYVQMQVAKFSDFDGAGELYASSNFYYQWWGSYNVFYKFFDPYLSDTDVLTPLINESNNSKKQQQIIDKQTETNSKIDDVKSKQDQTNSNLNDLKDKQDQTNSKIDDVKDSITSEDMPALDSLSNSAGWLPAGPLDSILNLPLSFLQNLYDNLSKTCQPVSLTLPYVNKTIDLPCLNSIYSQIEGLSPWINTIGVIASAFMLFSYLINLYKWVDDTLTLRENTYIDNWGGI